VPGPDGHFAGDSADEEPAAEQSAAPAPGIEEALAAAMEPVPMEPVAPPERRSRAGRNLPEAVAVGVGLGAAILVTVYTDKLAFFILVVAAVTLAVVELTNALTEHDVRVPRVPVLLGGAVMLLASYLGGPEPLVLALACTVLVVAGWRLALDPTADCLPDVTAGIFTAVYVPFLASFALLMLRADDGSERVVVFVLVTVASDIGGYAAGATLGRHPMAPSVSPKKSWEGFAGSACACAVVGALSVTVLIAGPWWVGVVIGLAAGLTATLGDLGESMIKRDLGIKDMGSLLPGHGGVLDRLDSLLPTAPVVYLLLALLVPTGS
jgi:phosphatidate cytidylyltransferase